MFKKLRIWCRVAPLTLRGPGVRSNPISLCASPGDTNSSHNHLFCTWWRNDGHTYTVYNMAIGDIMCVLCTTLSFQDSETPCCELLWVAHTKTPQGRSPPRLVVPGRQLTGPEVENSNPTCPTPSLSNTSGTTPHLFCTLTSNLHCIWFCARESSSPTCWCKINELL